MPACGDGMIVERKLSKRTPAFAIVSVFIDEHNSIADLQQISHMRPYKNAT
jgi:hypothetical protein